MSEPVVPNTRPPLGPEHLVPTTPLTEPTNPNSIRDSSWRRLSNASEYTAHPTTPAAACAATAGVSGQMPESVITTADPQPTCTPAVAPGAAVGTCTRAEGEDPGSKLYCRVNSASLGASAGAGPHAPASAENTGAAVRWDASCLVNEGTSAAQATGECAVAGSVADGVGGSVGVGGNGGFTAPTAPSAVNEAVNREEDAAHVAEDRTAGGTVNDGAGVSGVHGGVGTAAADVENAGGVGQERPVAQEAAGPGGPRIDKQFALGFVNALVLCAEHENDPEIVLAIEKLNKAVAGRRYAAGGGTSS